MLFANGVNPYEWSAKGEGDAMELSSTLQPLAAFKRDITVLRELHVFNNTSGPHWSLFSNYLSGAQFEETLIPEGSESIDQFIARHTGKETAVPSLVLAVETAESGLRSGVPGVYYGTVSWSSKNTPIAPEVYPRAVFDRLFDTSGLLSDKSVLDAVLAQSKDTRRGLGAQDQQKLDEFMTSLRDLEQRIDSSTRPCASPCRQSPTRHPRGLGAHHGLPHRTEQLASLRAHHGDGHARLVVEQDDARSRG